MTACATERVVEKPVLHESVRYKHIDVPPQHLVIHEKTAVPGVLTYGEAIGLWADDRATIDKLNGQIQAIKVLNDEASSSTDCVSHTPGVCRR